MYALIYLDDIIVYSKMEEEHLICLWAVLERFMEYGLKLKLSKCNFFHTEISYLGHTVSAAGMEPGTKGLKGIAEIAALATYTQVCKFLGATGYFRHFIKGHAKIAKPLNDLLQGENSKFKSQLLELPPDALMAFQELKMKCLTAPVLVFTDFKKPFLLETDASIEGLGAILSQKQDDGHYHPVAYASQGLKGGKLKYYSSKLEFLALKWAMTDQFKEYLQYKPFLVWGPLMKPLMKTRVGRIIVVKKSVSQLYVRSCVYINHSQIICKDISHWAEFLLSWIADITGFESSELNF